jgi:hypothetical protein
VKSEVCLDMVHEQGATLCILKVALGGESQTLASGT